MGWGKVFKEVKRSAKDPNKTAQNFTNWVADPSSMSVNDQTDDLREAWKSGGASVTNKQKYDAQKKREAAAKKEAERQAIVDAARAKAEAKQARLQRMRDTVARERSIGPGYVNSLSRMREAATPQGVQGARYGDINRGMSPRSPTQNVGLIRRQPMKPTGYATSMASPRAPGGVYSGPSIPRNPSPIRSMSGMGAMGRGRMLPGRPVVNSGSPTFTAGNGLNYNGGQRPGLVSQQPTVTAGQGLTYQGGNDYDPNGMPMRRF